MTEMFSEPVSRKFLLGFGIATLLLAGVAMAQRSRWNRGDYLETDRNGVPDWEIDQDFKDDVFTFVRIKYDSYGGYGRGGGGWRNRLPRQRSEFFAAVAAVDLIEGQPRTDRVGAD